MWITIPEGFRFVGVYTDDEEILIKFEPKEKRVRRIGFTIEPNPKEKDNEQDE